MSRVIEKYHPSCFSSDIRPDTYGQPEVNFLTYSGPETDNIITNPPYKLAKDFLGQSKIMARKKIALLLKLSFLEGQGRYQMFQDKEFALARVHVFCRRLNFYPDGDNTHKSGVLAFAWFVWDKQHKGQPTLHWIND